MIVIDKATGKEHDAVLLKNNKKEVMDFICFGDKELVKTGSVYDSVDSGDYVVHEMTNCNYKEAAFNAKYKVK